MTVFRDLRGLTLRVLAPAALVAAAMAVLVACGGGTSQAVKFKPTRLVVMGDDSSVLVDDGAANALKYSVNGLDANNARDCTVLPTMPQTVAAYYGFAFAACNKAGAEVRAFNRAQVGAKVSSPTSGLAAQVAMGALSADDLVTVYIGTNDLIELYELVVAGPGNGGIARADALVQAQQRGQAAADQINGILSTGARALVFLAPDMGKTPYAIAKQAGDTSAQQLLTDLSYQFNGYLRTRIDARRFDARNFGLIITDDAVDAVVKTPSNFATYLASPYNVSDAVCAAALPNCTSAAADLVSGGLYNTHLWANDRLLGYPGHALLGNQAQSRLNSLPF